MNEKKTLFFCVLVVGIAVAAVGFLPDGQADESPSEGWFNHVDYYVGSGDEVDRIRTRLIDELNEAETRVDAAIAVLDDPEISDALLAAADRGVAVRVVGDAHLADSDGFADLVAHDGVDVAFGNGVLKYLPDPTLSPLLEYCDGTDPATTDDYITCTRSAGSVPPQNTDNMMERPSHYNVMSHTFFLIDATYIWNITAPLTGDDATWLAFRAMSEEMTRSYEREFRQMHGGVFATTLSVYNGPLKSITHTTTERLTNRGHLRVRFNPQERLIKNLIDEVYRARSSVYIMTENFQNRDLMNALRYKSENGFPVRVMYGQTQGSTGRAVLEELAANSDDFELVQAPASMGPLPTFMVLNSEQDRNGERQPRLVQILSHELWRSEPFEVIPTLPDDWVRIYPSDTFADGVLWEVVESWSQRNPEAEPFVDTWRAMWNEAN